MERRTVALRDVDWRVLYETAVYLTMQQGRHVSLAQAVKVVFGVLRQQDWFRKNSDALLKEMESLSAKKEVSHADSSSVSDARVTPGG